MVTTTQKADRRHRTEEDRTIGHALLYHDDIEVLKTKGVGKKFTLDDLKEWLSENIKRPAAIHVDHMIFSGGEVKRGDLLVWDPDQQILSRQSRLIDPEWVV